MMTIMTFFFYVAAHIAFFTIGLLIYQIVRSRRKQNEDEDVDRTSSKNMARVITIVVILILMGMLLAGVRSENKRIIELQSDGVYDTDVTIYWDKYEQTFTYEGEKWVSLWMQTRNDWMEFDVDTFTNDRSKKWYADNVAFTIKKHLTPLEWLAATDYSTQLFYLENDTSKPMLMNFGEHLYCREKDRNEIIEYYDDLDHYYFMRKDKRLDEKGQKIFHRLKEISLEKPKEPKWLNSDKDWSDEGVKSYNVDIMSSDKNLDAQITIVKKNEKYYLTGSIWGENDDIRFNVRRIQDSLAKQMVPYLK